MHMKKWFKYINVLLILVSLAISSTLSVAEGTYKQALRQSYELTNVPQSPVMSLELASNKALVINQKTNEVIYAKNTNRLTPIASVTKLMTAMVILDSGVNLNEVVYISSKDIDRIKRTRSRLSVGTGFTRNELLHMALISSENRAASALASTFPGGRRAFITAMNRKALKLGMYHTYFADSTGLNKRNTSTAEDLVLLVNAAHQYSTIRHITTTANYQIYLPDHRNASIFNNTNKLIRTGEWGTIGVSKTGYIREAGRCLVMQAEIAGDPVIMVLLDSKGKYNRIEDARRVKQWVEYQSYMAKRNQVAEQYALNEQDEQVETPDWAFHVSGTAVYSAQ